jgi:uncharacterized membrane protein (UPF0136 family)
MPRKPINLFAIALGLAWAVDLLFWGQTGGLNYLLWVAFLLAGLEILRRIEGINLPLPSMVLQAVILSLAAWVLLRREGFTLFLMIITSLTSLVVLAATYTNGFWWRFRLLDFVMPILNLIGGMLARPFGLAGEIKSAPADDSAQTSWQSTRKRVFAVLRGLALALPLLLLLSALLASADLIFAQQLENMLKWFDIDRWGEYLFRFFYVLLFAFLITGGLLHSLLPRQQSEPPDHTKDRVKPFLGFTESAVVLGAVDLLFALFFAIQFRYLFGGEANITAAGFTYSEYARRGFGELLAVAIISLLVYLALSAVTRTANRKTQNAFSLLSSLLMLLVLTLLASSFLRLALYENAYGFSRLRTYTHFFIPWLGALLLATAAFEIARKRGFFTLALLISAFGFVTTMGVMNVDGFIVRQNVQRAVMGEEFDNDYLLTLSSDAVPELFRLASRDDLSAPIRSGLAANLACRADLLKNQEPTGWRSFNLSDHRARKILSQQTELWKDIKIQLGDYDGKQAVWENEVLNCYQYPLWD